MTERQNRYARPAVLFLMAAVPRVLAAVFLPNAFGDAYVYIQEIGTLSTKISNGNFRLTDLFGFWLPFYQLIAALLNLLVKNGFYSGKIVAAIFGAASCLFVYLVTRQLTKNETAALCIFLLIACNPLHIFYSGSAMTDVPHAFFVMATLYFALTGNWILAAICGACAGFTRVESWMLIALLPFIQFVKERRVSILPVVILLMPPLFWFYISWKATGNWLECFVQRQQYHDWLLQMNPTIASFSLINVLKDSAMLLVSSDIAVLLASLVAGWLVARRTPGWRLHPNADEEVSQVLAPVLVFFAFAGLLLVAYLTHQQPIIFPRYGLILFTLGLPILAWTFLWMRQHRPQFARTLLIVVVTLCVVDAVIQLAGAIGTINQYRAQRAVADYLRDHFDPSSEARIFCDEGTVRVLSGIGEGRFATSGTMVNIISSRNAGGVVDAAPQVKPDVARATFTKLLRANRVEYLVVADVQGSIASTGMQHDKPPEFAGFEPIFHSRAAFLPTDIWLLRVSTGAEPKAKP